MDEPQILSTIIGDTYTVSDLSRRLALIRAYSEHRIFLKSNPKNLETFLRDKGASELDIEIMTSWNEDFYNYFNKDNLYFVVKNLEVDLKTLVTITVYLPYTPNGEEVVKLGKWFRESLNTDILMDIKVNDQLIGGCAFVWKGIYKEFDLHFFLKKSRKELLNIFESYVKQSNTQHPN